MSGMLKSNRSSDSTYIGQTDNWNADLEEDIAAILGVPIDTAITAPIFTDGFAYTGTAVKNTGKIAGVLRFLTETPDKDLAGGVEFQHGTAKYKIAQYNDDLVLYSWNVDNSEWDILLNLSDSFSGAFTDLSDCPSEYASGDGGKLVRVKATEDGLEFASTSSVPVNLEDLDDVDPYLGNAGRYLALTDEATPTPVWTSVVPGAGVSQLTDLDDVHPHTEFTSAQEAFNFLGVSRFGSDPNYTMQWGRPYASFLQSVEPNYILDDWQNPTDIYFTTYESYQPSVGSPFLPIDEDEIKIFSYRPGVYMVNIMFACSSDGTNELGSGGYMEMFTDGDPLHGYAFIDISTRHIFHATPTGWSVTYMQRNIGWATTLMLRPTGAISGTRTLHFRAIKNYGANTVHIGRVYVAIAKVG